MTVTGKTIAENLADVPELDFDSQKIIQPLTSPIKPTGHLQVLFGNLATGGAVAKITGKEGERFEGIAKVCEREEEVIEYLSKGEIKEGQVVVIRNEGPKGGGYARNVETNFGYHGCRFGQQSSDDHRRSFLRWNTRIRCRSRNTRSTGRWQYRIGKRWRFDYD
jgi:hypothetical protein